jgi:hypothetical protein
MADTNQSTVEIEEMSKDEQQKAMKILGKGPDGGGA